MRIAYIDLTKPHHTKTYTIYILDCFLNGVNYSADGKMVSDSVLI